MRQGARKGKLGSRKGILVYGYPVGPLTGGWERIPNSGDRYRQREGQREREREAERKEKEEVERSKCEHDHIHPRGVQELLERDPARVFPLMKANLVTRGWNLRHSAASYFSLAHNNR